jgi:hypothetical protein
MKTPPAVLLCCGLFSLAACGKHSAGPGAKEKTTLHQDVAPHGGTPVAVGDDYKLELVRDGETGTLSGYVLDDEMEEFIRSSSPSLTIHVKATGGAFTLVLNAVANPATGERLGDTSLFQGRADWLRSVDSFAGTIEGVVIRGTQFSRITFNFPGGFCGSSD